MASIKAGLTALNTSAGTQAFSAGTATPKLGIHEVSSGLTAGTVADHYRWGFGVADGTTERAMAVLAEDGVALNADGEGRYSTTTCLQLTLTANNGADAEAAHSSFGAGSHTINITDAPAAANLNLFRLIGGTDVSVAIVDFTGSATEGGTNSITSLSFAPNLAIVFGRGNDTFGTDLDGAWSPLSMTLGYAVKTSSGAIEQFCQSDNVADRANPTNGRSTFRTNRCAQRLTTAADQGALELTTWLSNGASFTTRDANDACSVVIAFVRLPTRRLRAIVPSLVTSSTGNKTISGVGFQPFGYFAIASAITTADAGTSDAEHSKWSHGIVDDGASFTGCIGVQTEDNVATSDSRSVASSTQFARVVDDAGADEWSASHVSFNSDGVVINIDDASTTTDRKVGFVFWSADEATSVQSETVQVSETAVLRGAGVIVASETVQVSETEVLAGSGVLVASETVEVSETAILSSAGVIVADETIEISETAILVSSNMLTLVASETVEVSETALLNFSSLLVNEEIEVSEQVNFRGTGVGAVVNETVQVSESVLLFRGDLITANETVEISEEVNFGAGVIPGKADSGKGGTVQGGAESGKTYQGGARYGRTVQ